MSNETDKVTRKLRAILSADVKGYSLLMADDEVHTIQTLKAYRQVMADLIQAHSGRVVDNPGDNLLAEFSSAVDAVECAIEVQKNLTKENAKFVEDMKLQFRIGVNIGDVVHDGDRIYGSGVNVAARIEGIADAGGICLSRGTYDQVKNKIDLGFDYLGEYDVKNIKEPVRVYKVLMGTDAPKPLVEEELELPDKPSIAVLPFTNMSGDASQEYFSDGLTEQIINGLCKVSNLFVIGRNSSFAYKVKQITTKQIATELGVRYILEGSVQRAGNRIRITAQLIDAITDYHLWSENFDRELDDIFALQDEITVKTINSVDNKINWGEYADLWGRETLSLKAWELSSKALQCWINPNEKSVSQAQQYIKKLIEEDKTYAEAYVLLGFTHLANCIYGWSESPVKSFEEAEKNAQVAYSLNDSLDGYHLLMGAIHMFKRQHDEAMKEIERAIELNPNSADAYSHLAFLHCCLDRPASAISLLKEGIRHEPKPTPLQYSILSTAYRLNGQYDKAIEVSLKILSLYPDQLSEYLTLAACYYHLDRKAEAKKAAENVLRLDPKFSLIYYESMEPYKNRETLGRYINVLRKTGLPD
mgnify:CR=1 FL=1